MSEEIKIKIGEIKESDLTNHSMFYQGGGCGHLNYDQWNGDFDCDFGGAITCDECKYGGHNGRKDPEAKCNQG